MALIGCGNPAIFPPRKRGQSDGELRKALTARGAPSASTILTLTELNILRAMADGKSMAEGGLQKSTIRVQHPTAEDRKRRMLQYDETCRSSGVAPKTADDIEYERARLLHLDNARAKIDETYDEVKAMNRVIVEAKCVATREAQRLERARLKEEQKMYDQQMDEAMAKEAERAQQVYLERERCRLEEQRRSAEIIKEQLRIRDIDRIQKLERNQQEQEAMTRHIEKLHEEERAEKLRRQEAARRLMEDVAIANAEQIQLKSKQRELEQEEDRRMAEYIKQKEAREQALAEEQQRIRAEKEREVARMRANQQRAQDKRDEIDELRARRAHEAHVREQRRKDQEKKELDAAMHADLQRAHEEQMSEKRRMKAVELQQEQEELDRIYAVQQVALERERERRDRARQLHDENSLALLKQIMEVEERRRRERQEVVEEGHQFMRENREREAAMEAIRQRKLAELDQLHVPERYRQALIRTRKATV